MAVSMEAGGKLNALVFILSPELKKKKWPNCILGPRAAGKWHATCWPNPFHPGTRIAKAVCSICIDCLFMKTTMIRSNVRNHTFYYKLKLLWIKLIFLEKMTFQYHVSLSETSCTFRKPPFNVAFLGRTDCWWDRPKTAESECSREWGIMFICR